MALGNPNALGNLYSSLPQIKCMEMRKAEHIAASDNVSIWKDSECAQGSSDGLFCSIEIKDSLLPPWIICGICALMGSEGRSFEARFNEYESMGDMHQKQPGHRWTKCELFEGSSSWLLICY